MNALVTAQATMINIRIKTHTSATRAWVCLVITSLGSAGSYNDNQKGSTVQGGILPCFRHSGIAGGSRIPHVFSHASPTTGAVRGVWGRHNLQPCRHVAKKSVNKSRICINGVYIRKCLEFGVAPP